MIACLTRERTDRQPKSGPSYVVLLVFLFVFVLRGNCVAQENSWTNSSGNWSEPDWSLGVLPGPNQTIFLTNAGWKALAIDYSTVANHPETLMVNAIRISAPTNSFNTLLLNYAGLQTPLNAKSLIVASNSAVILLNSALNVASSGTETFSINGTLTAGNSLITAPYISAGAQGVGEVNLTNTLLSVPIQFFGGLFSATVNQAGGTNSYSSLHLNQCGYNLYEGFCSGDVVIGDNIPGSFHQFGGSFTGKVAIAHGMFELAGGTCNMPGLVIPAITYSTSGGLIQSGGTNNVGAATIGAFYGGINGYYTLSNGVLNSAGTFVSYNGSFIQAGGIHETHGALDVVGGIVYKGGGAAWAFYTMYDGMLRSDRINVMIGIFDQSGGTNRTGDLSIGPHYAQSTFDLLGGRLETINTTVQESWNGRFSNSGGVHIVSNLLSIATSSSGGYYEASYTLQNGTTQVKDIQVVNGSFNHIGGSLIHSGIVTLGDAGKWNESAGAQELGPLRLIGNVQSSVIDLSARSILHFTDSSSQAWSNQATLVIRNWDGAAQGGGAERIVFGSYGAGLTPQQVNQIRFLDPAGFPAGLYPAQILNTGELVPIPLLNSAQYGNQLVLQWSGAYTLQTATNINGPYADTTSAISPHTNLMTEAQRFFRLRR